jgi:predicted nucleic acid-binding protein
VAAVLVDAGALIALLDRSDAHHQASVDALESVTDPLLTVWPALTEAMHLLGRVRRGQDALFDMIDDAAVSIADLGEGDLRRMKVLMRKYRDLPMDFADAALVRVAERERLTRILTFDQDFSVYSLPGRARFVLLSARDQDALR